MLISNRCFVCLIRWYRPDMDRFEAERLLLRVHQEGAFLVRGSSEPGCLSLSFRLLSILSLPLSVLPSLFLPLLQVTLYFLFSFSFPVSVPPSPLSPHSSVSSSISFRLQSILSPPLCSLPPLPLHPSLFIPLFQVTLRSLSPLSLPVSVPPSPLSPPSSVSSSISFR